jgi:hypothetical protein
LIMWLRGSEHFKLWKKLCVSAISDCFEPEIDIFLFVCLRHAFLVKRSFWLGSTGIRTISICSPIHFFILKADSSRKDSDSSFLNKVEFGLLVCSGRSGIHNSQLVGYFRMIFDWRVPPDIISNFHLQIGD